MNFTGNILNVAKDWLTGKWTITLQVEEQPTEAINALAECKLSIILKKFRKKRSLDSNAYAWQLMQKIAEATHTDKWSVYLQALQDHSRAFSHVIVKPNAVERMKQLYRTCIDLGEVTVNGQTGHQLQVYYGSSDFDTKEMSVFIDGIVRQCKDLGIETLPPHELERMKAEWNQ